VPRDPKVVIILPPNFPFGPVFLQGDERLLPLHKVALSPISATRNVTKHPCSRKGKRKGKHQKLQKLEVD
jgi:hypothetical protein